MGRTKKRAVLLNKDDDESRHIHKEDFKDFIKEFIKISKKQMASPPTDYEKALIVARPQEELKRKSPKKAILPELVEKKTILKTRPLKKKEN